MSYSAFAACIWINIESNKPSHPMRRKRRKGGRRRSAKGVIIMEIVIKFLCVECQQSLEAPLEMAGQILKCPTCSATITVPSPQTPPPPVPIVPVQPPSAQPPETKPHYEKKGSKGYTNQETYKVGTNQKAIIWLVLASFIAFFIPYAPIVVGIICIVFVYRLAKALKLSLAWLWALSQILPFISIICLLVLNHKATSILKAKGIRVGLMGARSEQLTFLNSNTSALTSAGTVTPTVVDKGSSPPAIINSSSPQCSAAGSTPDKAAAGTDRVKRDVDSNEKLYPGDNGPINSPEKAKQAIGCCAALLFGLAILNLFMSGEEGDPSFLTVGVPLSLVILSLGILFLKSRAAAFIFTIISVWGLIMWFSDEGWGAIFSSKCGLTMVNLVQVGISIRAVEATFYLKNMKHNIAHN